MLPCTMGSIEHFSASARPTEMQGGSVSATNGGVGTSVVFQTSCSLAAHLFARGPFSSFSIGVTIAMWEEIINQLLMLLSY